MKPSERERMTELLRSRNGGKPDADADMFDTLRALLARRSDPRRVAHESVEHTMAACILELHERTKGNR